MTKVTGRTDALWQDAMLRSAVDLKAKAGASAPQCPEKPAPSS